MSIFFSPYAIPLGRQPARFAVYRYHPSGQIQYMPNVLCLSISDREGPDVGSARFRYVTSQTADPIFPRYFQQVFPLDSPGPYVVGLDDRLIVTQYLPDGGHRIVFDGFAKLPELQLGRGEELVPFQAMATPEREFDTPIGGATYRDADDISAKVDVLTSLPVRFNPDGLPNATPDGEDSEAEFNPDVTHPVFVDPLVVADDPAKGRLWTVGMAVRYLIATGNFAEEFVRNRNFSALDAACSARVPTEGNEFINYDETSTWEFKDIICPDFEVTGITWPEAVAELIRPHGFRLVWRLATSTALPEWWWRIVRDDDPIDLKWVGLQLAGEALDPARTNLGSAQLSRDLSRVVNRIEVDSAPRQVEISVTLAPAFEIDAADAGAEAIKAFNRNAEGFDPTKYRTYIFDEVGEGHWDYESDQWVTFPGDLAPALQTSEFASFVKRRRPALQSLFSTDADGKRLRAQLWFAKLDDYDGPVPGVWDGESGIEWQQATKGWQLLKDRLGIVITDDDIEGWSYALSVEAEGKAAKSPKLNLVISQTDTGPIVSGTKTPPRIVFRLTCVIEDDQGLNVVAERRSASPTAFPITRRVDTRDRFVRRTISRFSHLSTADEDEDSRDDTEQATRYAESMRRADEMARFGGQVTIPRFTGAYLVGDKLTHIAGREMSLRINVGAESGESPQYPVIVGRDWQLDGDQSTTLHLSDRRAAPANYTDFVSEPATESYE